MRMRGGEEMPRKEQSYPHRQFTFSWVVAMGKILRNSFCVPLAAQMQ